MIRKQGWREGGREQQQHQGETWEQASSQQKKDAGVRAACCTWPKFLRPMLWHQRFIFSRASTPRPRPGSRASFFALLRLRGFPRSCWNSTINCQKENTTKLLMVDEMGKDDAGCGCLFFLCFVSCRLWRVAILFSVMLNLLGVLQFGWCYFFCVGFLVDSRPLLRRRCSKWNKSCQFKDGYTGVECYQNFLLLNVCKLLYGGEILVRILGFMDGGGMPLYGKPNSLLRLCNFSLHHEFQLKKHMFRCKAKG